jgi:hypothetical protein
MTVQHDSQYTTPCQDYLENFTSRLVYLEHYRVLCEIQLSPFPDGRP